MIDHTGASPVTYYIHTDQLGRPQKMTDASANLVWDAIFQPFGEVYAVSGSATNYLMFPGQFYDGETQLSQNWRRDYDPTIGRYIQSDPIGLAGGINTYGYVGGNPLGHTDPSGLFDPAPLTAAERAALAEEAIGLGPENPMVDFLAGMTLGVGLYVAITSPDPNDKPGNQNDSKCDWQKCLDDFVQLTDWCHKIYPNPSSRERQACHSLADENLSRCRNSLPRKPWPFEWVRKPSWYD